MSGLPRTRVVVTVGEDKLDALPEVVAHLERAGLQVEGVLELLGQVTGQVETTLGLASLRAVEGVQAVEREGQVQLPPPDSTIA